MPSPLFIYMYSSPRRPSGKICNVTGLGLASGIYIEGSGLPCKLCIYHYGVRDRMLSYELLSDNERANGSE
jgi:hypothetical protein